MDANSVGIAVSNILADAYRRILAEKKKIATRSTINSITPRHRLKKDGVVAYVESGKGLFFIENDKRANTKLPVRKVGGKFKLVPELEAWKKAVGFGGPDYLLARSLAKKPRKGIDITGMVLEDERANIAFEIGQIVTDDIEKTTVNELRNAFKNF